MSGSLELNLFNLKMRTMKSSGSKWKYSLLVDNLIWLCIQHVLVNTFSKYVCTANTMGLLAKYIPVFVVL